MVATVRCEEIANEKYAAFVANEVRTFLFVHLPRISTISITNAVETAFNFHSGMVSIGRDCAIWSYSWIWEKNQFTSSCLFVRVSIVQFMWHLIFVLSQFVSFMKTVALECAILMLHNASCKNEDRWLIELLHFLFI